MATLRHHLHLDELHPLIFLAERVRPVLAAAFLTALAPAVTAAFFCVWVALAIGLATLL